MHSVLQQQKFFGTKLTLLRCMFSGMSYHKCFSEYAPAVTRNDFIHCDFVPDQRLSNASNTLLVVCLCVHGWGQEGGVSHTWRGDRSCAGSILFEVSGGVRGIHQKLSRGPLSS